MCDPAIVLFVFQTEMGGWALRLAVGIYVLMLAVTAGHANEGGNIKPLKPQISITDTIT